jgi:hypothetical protein
MRTNKEFDNTNRGYLMPRAKTENHETGPDMSGQINISGRTYWLKAWNAKSHDGRVYVRLSVQEVRDVETVVTPATAA